MLVVWFNDTETGNEDRLLDHVVGHQWSGAGLLEKCAEKCVELSKKKTSPKLYFVLP